VNPNTLTERQKSWLTLATLWFFLLLLATLRPLAVPDEGRYAEVGRWMMQSGDWLTPRLDGLPFFHKPPLLHWLETLSLSTFGVNVWAARLVPALHAGLMMLGLYLTARQVACELVARRALLMLGTSLAILVGGQYVNHDMMVATWISTAIWCFGYAFMHADRPHALWARLGFVACALGVLSKGMIGLALPGLVLLLWLLATRQLRKVLYLPWISGLLLFGALAVPWFVLAQRQFPGLLDYMFGVQQFSRYTGNTFNNQHPWWFYLMALVVLLFPWIFFAFAPAWRTLRKAPEAASPVAKPWILLCWIWVAAIVGFFSVPQSKLVGYILPVMPPLALLSALGWEQLMAQRRHARRWFAALAVLAVTLAVVLNAVSEYMLQDKLAKDVAQTLACNASPSNTVYVMGGYPYDLPFYVQIPKPMVVLQDWPELRRSAGDGWQRELFEGADFDVAAGRVLQSPEVLTEARTRPGQWLLTPRSHPAGDWQQGWTLVQQGTGWTLYRSSAPESPEATQHKGLPGCKHQGNQQRAQ